MSIDEKALKKVLHREVLFICIVSKHTEEQLINYIFNNAPLSSFDSQSKKELAEYYSIIKDAYFLETKDFIPNIFVELEV